MFELERTVTCYVCFLKKYGLQRTEWLWSTVTWFLLPPNSQKKNEKMSQASFLQLYFSPPQFTPCCTPKRLPLGHRHYLSILVFFLLLLLHEVTEGAGKMGKIETVKNFFFFWSGNGDFFLDNFFAVKGGFWWLLLLGNLFQKSKVLLPYKNQAGF